METDLLARIGQRIKRQRLLTDLTQGDVAKEFGCAQSAISAIEKGDNRPSLEFLIWFAERTATSVEYLVTGAKTENKAGPAPAAQAETLGKVVTDFVRYLITEGKEGTGPVAELLAAYSPGAYTANQEETRLLKAFRRLPPRRRQRLIEDAEEFAAAYGEMIREEEEAD